MNYILIILADILLSFEFAFSKKYQSIETNSLAAGLRFNTVSGLFTAIIFFALSGFKLDFSAFSVLFALAMSLCAATYSILGFSVLKKGNMAIYSVFLMSGGMILPYIFWNFVFKRATDSLKNNWNYYNFVCHNSFKQSEGPTENFILTSLYGDFPA